MGYYLHLLIQNHLLFQNPLILIPLKLAILLSCVNEALIKHDIQKNVLNLIYLYLNTNQKQKAVNVLDKINIDDVVPYQLKNKFEQLKSL